MLWSSSIRKLIPSLKDQDTLFQAVVCSWGQLIQHVEDSLNYIPYRPYFHCSQFKSQSFSTQHSLCHLYSLFLKKNLQFGKTGFFFIINEEDQPDNHYEFWSLIIDHIPWGLKILSIKSVLMSNLDILREFWERIVNVSSKQETFHSPLNHFSKVDQ